MNGMRASRIVVAGGVCLLLSAAMNVALAVRISVLRDRIETGGGERQEMVGRQMETLVGTNPTGDPVRVEFGEDGRPAVLYVFAPGCGWCDRNYEAVIALHTAAADRYRFVALSLEVEGLQEYTLTHPLPFEVVTGVDRELIEGYKLGRTPRTLVIDSEGAIESNFVGAWTGGNGRGVEAAFGVELPELEGSLW